MLCHWSAVSFLAAVAMLDAFCSVAAVTIMCLWLALDVPAFIPNLYSESCKSLQFVSWLRLLVWTFHFSFQTHCVWAVWWTAHTPVNITVDYPVDSDSTMLCLLYVHCKHLLYYLICLVYLDVSSCLSLLKCLEHLLKALYKVNIIISSIMPPSNAPEKRVVIMTCHAFGNK